MVWSHFLSFNQVVSSNSWWHWGLNLRSAPSILPLFFLLLQILRKMFPSVFSFPLLTNNLLISCTDFLGLPEGVEVWKMHFKMHSNSFCFFLHHFLFSHFIVNTCESQCRPHLMNFFTERPWGFILFYSLASFTWGRHAALSHSEVTLGVAWCLVHLNRYST